jgi:hypothetical protein
MQRREADAIDQLGWPLDVPDRQIAGFAGFERADLIEPAQRACRWRVTPSRHSSTVSRKKVAAMFIVSNSEVSGEVPGLESLEMAIGTLCLRRRSTGGFCVSRRK